MSRWSRWLIRAASGAAAPVAAVGRRAGVRRRGSILILIVGAMAMLSVVTLVYFAVGRADRRTAQVAVDRNRIDDVIARFRDYLADDVIGADALATYVDGRDTGLMAASNPDGVILRREAFDYPSTDRSLRSVPAAGRPWEKFNPVGTYRDAWNPGGSPANDPFDPRMPSDPWLADAEPTWLGATPPAGGIPAYAKLDWGHVSNVAPSGNFVNLWNLRGNFDAPSGFLANGRPRSPGMSDNMSLLGPITAIGGQPPAAMMTLDYGGTLRPNNPAHLDSRQRFAARPARDLRYRPDQPEYALYQWADVDGDGILDAKFFEMIDVSDPLAPRSLLPADDHFRWFWAVRIIDLAGRINVNTAADFKTAPDRDTPAGASPAEVDLLRLLGLSDVYAEHPNAGYDRLQPPFIPNSPDDYAGYTAVRAGPIGLLAYQGLRLTTETLIAPDPGPFQVTPLPTMTARDRFDYFRRMGGQGEGAGYSISGGFRLLSQGGLFDQSDLRELLTYNGVNDPATLSRLEQALGGGRGRNGNPPWNLGPLRDNRSAAVERDSVDNFENGFQGNGVLDDDALVRLASDVRQRLTTVSAARPLGPSAVRPGFEGTLDLARDLKIDAVEALQSAATGAANTRDPSLLLRGYSEALMPHSWRAGAWDSVNPASRAMRTLAYGHNPLLAAWTTGHMVANMADLYDDDAGTGIVGSGVALPQHIPGAFTMALAGDQASLAFIDANSTGLAAMYPFWSPRPATPGQPRPQMAGTLDLDWAFGLRQTNNPNIPPQNPLPPSRLARQGDLPVGAPKAVNIFGVEAQPFIVEAATVFVYTDAPYSAYDPPIPSDADEYVPPSPGPIITPGINNPVTINGDIRSDNPDFLCQVLAFQITNPFDADIGLTKSDVSQFANGAAVPDEYSDYYVEFGGNVFKLAEVDGTGANPKQVVLKRRDPSGASRDNTRVFYVLNENFDAILTRWNKASPRALNGGAAGGSGSFGAQRLRELIERQVGLAFTPAGGGPAVTAAPILIARMNESTGATVNTFTNLMSGSAGAQAADNMSVKLWRVIRTQNVDPQGQPNLRLNDMLADRLHDPVDMSTGSWRPTLDRRLPAGQHPINGTVAGPDPTGPNASGSPQDNTGFSIAFWASFKRPDDPRPTTTGVPRIPLGALPAYCIEAKAGWAVTPVSGRPLSNFEDPSPAPTPTTSLDKAMFSGIGSAAQGRIAAKYLYKAAGGVDSLWHVFGDPTQPYASPPQADAVKGTIREFPEEKSAQVIPRNNANKSYAQMYPEVPLNNRRFEATINGQNVSILRLGDMLLPLAVGPMAVPDPAQVGTPLYRQDASWLTLGEAMALSLGFASPPPNDPLWSPVEGLGGFLLSGAPNSASGTARPRVDRGNLVLDDFAPFENNDLDAAETFNPSGLDRRRAPGMPLALSIFDQFRTIEPQFGSLTRGTPGLVNVNAASVPVLRCLPLLSPGVQASGVTNPDWWGMSVAGMSALNDADGAAALAAYRDKAQLLDRAGGALSFGDYAGPLLGAGLPPGHPLSTTLDDASTWNGRQGTTRIEAIRESPGLASMGELMALIDQSGSNRVPVADQIDRLGVEATPADSGAPGVVSTLYRANGAATTPTVINEIADDFAEKLIVASGLAGTVSVRSDVFAVWFVVHGYQRSDTENLGPSDPLVPTIQRRYVMVVDRSNVSRLGDKPRILFMSELPR